MTTQTEALKLALEALEDRTSLMKWQMARDSVKEALAQPAVAEQHKQEPDLGGVDVFYPKDEHYKTVISDVQRLFNDNRQSASDAVQKEIDAYKAANPHCDVVAIVGDLAPYRRRTLGLPDSAPLYTTKPQRKPLTEKQMAEVFSATVRYGISDVYKFARAIEAAHGIKE